MEARILVIYVNHCSDNDLRVKILSYSKLIYQSKNLFYFFFNSYLILFSFQSGKFKSYYKIEIESSIIINFLKSEIFN